MWVQIVVPFVTGVCVGTFYDCKKLATMVVDAAKTALPRRN